MRVGTVQDVYKRQLLDYAAETEDESYCLLWEAMNAEFEQLGAQGCTTANCVFTDGMIILMR